MDDASIAGIAVAVILAVAMIGTCAYLVAHKETVGSPAVLKAAASDLKAKAMGKKPDAASPDLPPNAGVGPQKDMV